MTVIGQTPERLYRIRAEAALLLAVMDKTSLPLNSSRSIKLLISVILLPRLNIPGLNSTELLRQSNPAMKKERRPQEEKHHNGFKNIGPSFAGGNETYGVYPYFAILLK
jgi:hypothetical protein